MGQHDIRVLWALTVCISIAGVFASSTYPACLWLQQCPVDVGPMMSAYDPWNGLKRSARVDEGQGERITHTAATVQDLPDEIPQSDLAEESNHDPYGRFIVRFRVYNHSAVHRRSLEQTLGPEGRDWRWIERHNKASEYPTDFALISVHETFLQALRPMVEMLPHFRGFHPDQRLVSRLKWLPEDGSQRVAAGNPSSSSIHVGVEHLSELHGGQSAEEEPKSIAQPGEGSPAVEQEEEEEYGLFKVTKKPGRFTTRPTMGLDDYHYHGDELRRRRRDLKVQATGVTAQLEADKLWAQGFSGQKVKVGVFDTGIRHDHPHLRNIVERTNWTHQDSFSDGLGHGTFVAGVIGSQDASCPGFAPDVELYTFKVFTDDQVSYTSWFMDAFNYAIAKKVNIINLSIGGPDFLDQPFVEKIWEVTSNGILMISAIGNDGPLYGTLNNPADQNDVIGVGGIDDYSNLASFSSRGMTTWELPLGYGRVKPDVVAYAKNVQGSRIQGGCRDLSGTSVASPVVAGGVCLLASTVPEEKRWDIINPASMKQALAEGAVRLDNLNIYEQGHGRINLVNSHKILSSYTPRASVLPTQLDFTQCPYMWPFCKQPLYAHSMPLMFNATVLNGMGVVGHFDGEVKYEALDEGGKFLKVITEHSEVLWPWSGYLAVFIHVAAEAEKWEGIASGMLRFTIQSPPARGESQPRRSEVSLPIKVNIIPTPDRKQRVLWDQFHSIKYPPGYIPRDNLDIKSDILDWHGDHLHTNFHQMFNDLRERGYFVEVLSSPLTCFDARQYGALLLVDSEEEFYKEEVEKLEKDIKEHGLTLLVFAEWYNLDSMSHMRFFDDNTRSWWTPATGGSNVPALNDLLAPYGIALGEAILTGHLAVGQDQLTPQHGANIAKFPKGGLLFQGSMNNHVGKGQGVPGNYAGFGIMSHGTGKVAVYGDSNCLDGSHMSTNCFEFLGKLLAELAKGEDKGLASAVPPLAEGFGAPDLKLPSRRKGVNFTEFSFVLSNALRCYSNAPCLYQQEGPCKGKVESPTKAQVKVDEVNKVVEKPATQEVGDPRRDTAAAVVAKLKVNTSTPQVNEEPASSSGNPALTRDTASAVVAKLKVNTSKPQVNEEPTSSSGNPTLVLPTDNLSDYKQPQPSVNAASGLYTQSMRLTTVIGVFGIIAIVTLWRMSNKRRGALPYLPVRSN